MRIGITGAAGNLGGLLAEHLLDTTRHHLHLLVHDRGVSAKLHDSTRTSVFKADLADTTSLDPFLRGTDVVIHFAGVLFKARPERFLPTTNTRYFRNLCDTAVSQGVRRIILVSFPHVEGETTPKHPATGRLDGRPISAHARTRLAEEKYLFESVNASGLECVSLRVGMVYGRGILMIDAARWFARHNLLGVWKRPTDIHLISTADFLESAKNAIIRPGISGIYHIGDEGVQTLQEFLDIATETWGYKRPWVMPYWMIQIAAVFFELQSLMLRTRAPLTRDFVRIGRVSYYGDTSRMRKDLLPVLKYRTIKEGSETLK